MKIENGKIIEAKRDELYHRYIAEDWDEITTFPEYLLAMAQSGVKIVKEEDHERKRADD